VWSGVSWSSNLLTSVVVFGVVYMGDFLVGFLVLCGVVMKTSDIGLPRGYGRVGVFVGRVVGWTCTGCCRDIF
jgi:hypothetical protein